MDLYALSRSVLLGTLSFALCATGAWAGCDANDRPKTPSGLKLGPTRNPHQLELVWTNNQTRTGLTFFDIHARDTKGNSILNLTGGAGQEMKAGCCGVFLLNNMPDKKEIIVSMRSRTKPGSDGCVSEPESGTATFGMDQ